jgi:hypothetical protein
MKQQMSFGVKVSSIIRNVFKLAGGNAISSHSDSLIHRYYIHFPEDVPSLLAHTSLQTRREMAQHQNRKPSVCFFEQ